jgi:alkanesulfonate monooxygenase SsuD/methylene tetrahydromethanopterin reductase-like flavin-dependent oxidoreductase (luciferase family)
MAQVGIMVEGQEGLTWERWRGLCTSVEALGFDSLWRSDHLSSVFSTDNRDCLETWVSLALAAEWTNRIQFGPLVSPMTFRWPAILARMAASVDQLSGGRLVLGVGAGWYKAEHDRFQIPFPTLGERMDGLELGIRFMRHIWAESLRKPARERVPILVGGSGKGRTLRIVAEHADQWNAIVQHPSEYAALSRLLDGYCRDIGRDPNSIRRSVMISFIVGRDESDLRARATLLRQVYPEFAGLSPETIVERLRSRAPGRWLAGTPDEVAAQMSAFVQLGVERLILQHDLMDDFDALKMIANDVLPSVHAQRRSADGEKSSEGHRLDG